MERELIDWLSREFGTTRYARLGIGDDCAVLPAGTSDLVVTCDVICDGVHFQSAQHSPEQIGYKALAVNLSDLAAMGAMPRCATVSLVIPRTVDIDYVKRLYAGIKPLSLRYQTDICGGDTTVWPGRLAIAVSAIGLAPAAGCWRIDGATAGDRILVTGRLGGSILGKHMCFEPRCDFASRWRDSGLVSACTDISDSLGLDLAKIARASGVGFEISAEAVPVSAAARQRSDALLHQTSAVQHALQDGEDFELIVIASPGNAVQLQHDTPAEIGLADIGQITADREEYWLLQDGVRRPLIPAGFEHRLGDPLTGESE